MPRIVRKFNRRVRMFKRMLGLEEETISMRASISRDSRAEGKVDEALNKYRVVVDGYQNMGLTDDEFQAALRQAKARLIQQIEEAQG